MNDEISIILKAKDEASKVIEDVAKNTKASFADISKQVSAGMLVAGTAITGFLGVAVKSAVDAQAEMAIVNTQAENFGKRWADAHTTAVEMTQKFNDAVREASDSAIRLGFDDEDASKSVAKFATTTGDLELSQRMLVVAMDLARQKGISLEDATSKLNLVMMGNTKVAKELGVEIEKGATKLDTFGAIEEKVKGQAEAFSKTFKGQMEILQVSVGNIKEAIGDQLLPIITKWTDKIGGVVRELQKWIEKNPELFENIVKFSAMLGGVLVVLGGIGLILPPIVAGFTAMISPVGLITLAIVLLTVAGWKFYNWLKDTNQSLREVIALIDKKTGLITLLRTAWDMIVKTFQERVMPAVQKLWKALEPYMPYLKELVKIIGVALLGAFMAIVAVITTAVVVALGVLSEAVKLITGIINAFVAVWDYLIDRFKQVVDWISRVIEKIKTMIAEFRKAKSEMGGGITGAIGAIGKSVFGLASGGIVSQPTYALVGEGGEPEAVMPLSKLREFIGEGGGGGMTVNINGGYYLSEDVARELGSKIIDILKLNRRV